MCLGKDIGDTETLSFIDLALKNSKQVEILGITLDRSMGFNTHIKNICRKAGQKLSALLRISPLVWMFCSRPSNNLIDEVHERGLQLTCRKTKPIKNFSKGKK